MRWLLFLLALGAAGWSAEQEPPPALSLEPGDDYSQLEALGWVEPWQVEDSTLMLRFHAPAGAAWTADDVVRVEAESYRVVVQPWQGGLEPDAFDMELWSPEATCLHADLLTGQASGTCQEESRMRLHLGLPPGASGSGSVVVAFESA